MAKKHAGIILVGSFLSGVLFTGGVVMPHALKPCAEPFFGLEDPREKENVQKNSIAVEKSNRDANFLEVKKDQNAQKSRVKMASVIEGASSKPEGINKEPSIRSEPVESRFLESPFREVLREVSPLQWISPRPESDEAAVNSEAESPLHNDVSLRAVDRNLNQPENPIEKRLFSTQRLLHARATEEDSKTSSLIVRQESGSPDERMRQYSLKRGSSKTAPSIPTFTNVVQESSGEVFPLKPAIPSGEQPARVASRPGSQKQNRLSSPVQQSTTHDEGNLRNEGPATNNRTILSRPMVTDSQETIKSKTADLDSQDHMDIVVDSDSLGAAPLPGESLNDPDRRNWSDSTVESFVQQTESRPEPRLALRNVPDQDQPRVRMLPRIWMQERVLPRMAEALGTRTVPYSPPSVVPIDGWPNPAAMFLQIEQIHGDQRTSGWIVLVQKKLADLLATRGPQDPSAGPLMVELNAAVAEGMHIADVSENIANASSLRRSALALSRRVVVWQAVRGAFESPSLQNVPNEEELIHIQQQSLQLINAIEQFESGSDDMAAMNIATTVSHLSRSPVTAAEKIVIAVGEHYMAPNVRLAIHQRLLDKLMPESSVETGRVAEIILGHKVSGTRTVEQSTTIRFIPDTHTVNCELEVSGKIDSRTVTDTGGVSMTSRGASKFIVHKPIKLSPNGLSIGPAKGTASTNSRLSDLETSFDSVPVVRSLVREIAKNQREEKLPEANQEIINKLISQACRRVDDEAGTKIKTLEDQIRQKVWQPLDRLGLAPTAVAFETAQSRATVRLRLAADGQLASHTPRPRAPPESLLSLQVNDSSLNNMLDRLGLAGKNFALEDLLSHVSRQLSQEPQIPEDLPEGVRIVFASHRPLHVEFRDGLVHVRVALASIEFGRRSWQDVVAQVCYKPSINVRKVVLEREGPIQIGGEGHRGRFELALRTIFGKIFAKERPIQVMPEKLVVHPRLQTACVVQAISDDHWFSIAMADTTELRTVGNPQPARQ